MHKFGILCKVLTASFLCLLLHLPGHVSPSDAFVAPSNNATSPQKGGREGHQQHASAMELIVGILKDAPVHKELELPYMKTSALKMEVKKRLGSASKWDKVWYGMVRYGTRVSHGTYKSHDLDKIYGCV